MIQQNDQFLGFQTDENYNIRYGLKMTADGGNEIYTPDGKGGWNLFDKIPMDTSASIFTAGLLGEQYIGLEPGAEEEYLSDNSELDPGLTQSAVILEQLIGQFLYSTAAKGVATDNAQ